MSILVVGDPHTEPNQSLERFDILGEFIVKHKPETIIMMGDFLTLDSLSDYDRGKPGKLEGRRLSAELHAGYDAILRTEGPMREYNLSQKKKKGKQYHPTKVYLEGNHEYRWKRYLDVHPEMKDTLYIYEQIGLYDYDPWNIIKFREYYGMTDIQFTHIPMNSINRPISGVRVVQTALAMHDDSVVFGHTHNLEYASNTRLWVDKGRRIFALNCGWFGEDIPEYAVGSYGSSNWWSGLVVLERSGLNMYDINTYSMEKLRRGNF